MELNRVDYLWKCGVYADQFQEFYCPGMILFDENMERI